MEKYIQELNSFCHVKNAIVIEGNIDDIYSVWDDVRGCNRYVSLIQLIYSIADSNNEECELVYCNATTGFDDPLHINNTKAFVDKYQKLLGEEHDALDDINTDNHREPHSSNKLITNAEIIRMALTSPLTNNDKPKMIVLDNASRLCTNPENLTKDEEYIFFSIQSGICNAYNGNRLVMICEKADDIPLWIRNSCYLKTVVIPTPSRESREKYITDKMTITKKEADELLDFSDRLKLVELKQIYTLYSKCNCTMEEAKRIYRYGVSESFWDQFGDKINNMDIVEELNKYVKGQDDAKQTIAKVLKKAVNGYNNLSDASHDLKPVAKIFLGGPTGTGKTALVKALSNILFGDENAIKLFNMSEFMEKGSEQRLIGSPPGYVGYGEQAELIQAIKEGYHIFVFDEFEKSNVTIEKLMLGFMDSGMVTSGSGETVYAGDSIMFFTSNVGICDTVTDSAGIKRNKLNVRPSDGRAMLIKTVKDGIKNRFQPEFIGRLTDTVIYDYLDSEVASQITKQRIDTIVKKLSKKEITLRIDESVFQYFAFLNEMDESIEYGARSIVSSIERLSNAIANYLIENSGIKDMTVKYVDNDFVFEGVKC